MQTERNERNQSEKTQKKDEKKKKEKKNTNVMLSLFSRKYKNIVYPKVFCCISLVKTLIAFSGTVLTHISRLKEKKEIRVKKIRVKKKKKHY